MNKTAHFPVGTITFLFTDIEGSTKLWEAQPDAMRIAVARHDAILRQAVEDNSGSLFKTTGDGIAAAFALASDGLAAAVAAQIALAAEPWPEDTVLRSRMGLHTGAAELRDGDYFGPTLNRAARLMAAGHGGQTLLSDVTRELTRDSLPEGVSLLTLGERRLKDLTRPETIYQLAHLSLTAEFPPLRTLDNPEMPNNLPQQVTSFVGREKPLADVAALLGKTRLLTLTGSGGSGKTRLSLQAAADALEVYPDGAWLVELAALADSALVPQTVAAALGVREQPGQAIMQTLTDFLKPRRLLLVLDNCEHVLGACAALVAALMRACPQLSVIATSREPLGIAGETTYRVPALSLPSESQAKGATPESLTQYEAVRLFIERAQAVKPDFSVTNANAPSLAQLCYRLDGIPLAIELAAARVRSLPVEQINDKLDSRFRLLTGGDRSALPRQQTLRALIDWSYDLISESEKTLLARLSVFAGGWTLDAAEAIAGFDPIEDFEVLDLLTGLADKSLVLAEEESGKNRYRMLETIRQYAGERLATGIEATDLKVRHREFFVAFAKEAESHLAGPELVAWLNRLETEHDNLRVALDTCASRAVAASGDSAQTQETAEAALSGLQIAAALWRFWQVRGYLSEGRAQLERALRARPGALNGSFGDATQSQAQEAIAAAFYAGGVLAHIQGAYAAARSLLEESLRLSREIGDETGIAASLNSLGSVASSQGDYAAARSLYEESLSLRREIGNKTGIAASLHSLGILASNQGDYATAKSLYEEGLSLGRELGNKRGVAASLQSLGILASNQGDYAAARLLHEESLSFFREIGDKGSIAFSLNSLGSVASSQGDYAAARSLCEESLNLFREIGNKEGIAYSLLWLGNTATDQTDYAAARSLHEESLSVFREIGNRRGAAFSLISLGFAVFNQSDYAAARSLWEESLSINREIGNKQGIGSLLIHLGNVAQRQSDHAAARLLYAESLSLHRELREMRGIAYGLKGLASVSVSERDARRALVLWASAGALLESIGAPMPPADQAKQDAETEPLRAKMGAAAFAASWDEGRALTWEQSVELALRKPINDNATQDPAQ